MNNLDFTPIFPVYYDVISIEQEEEFCKVFYFGKDTELLEAKGKIYGIEKESKGEFLIFDSGEKARIDRIITINGKPGPAYEEYDRYALACLDCSAGME